MVVEQRKREGFSMKKACKRCRREGAKLMLKGDRCFTTKCAFSRRSYVPGDHGPTQRTKLSEFGRQLREKQKSKSVYGISESTLSKYYKLADKAEGNTTENLIKILELRIDNVVYRAGFASSRSQSRQKVSHGLVSLNGKRVTVPSIILSEKDKVKINYKAEEKNVKSDLPNWISVDMKKKEIIIKHIPQREEVDLSINESLVAEYYSR